MFKKAKPILIMAAVAIGAVMLWNLVIQPRLFGGKLPSA
jgi:hypothetical protein